MKTKLRRAFLALTAAAASLVWGHANAQVLAGVASVSVFNISLPASVALQSPLDESDKSSPRAFGFAVLPLEAPTADKATLPERELGAQTGLVSPVQSGLARLNAPTQLFGGVELRVGRTVHSDRWRELLGERAVKYFVEGCGGAPGVCSSPAYHRIATAINAAAGEHPLRAIERINRAVNDAITFTDDARQYGVRDHWATAAETLRSGRGDCEDYALLKYWALAAAGVPQETMRLVLVRDVRRRLDHAVLAVSYEGTNLVLDNLTSDLKADGALRHYDPRISFASNGSWLHGRVRPQIRTDVAALAQAR